jgi:hypothetical protein
MGKKGPKQVKIAEWVSGQKNPISSHRIESRKEPKEAERVEFLNMKASWRINKIQMVDPYGWHGLNIEDINHIKERLSNFETMTWNEIFVQSKKHNHSIPVEDFRCEHARRWMKSNMPDQLELWTLRFNGPERVWGIFAEGAYQVIFWDPEHRIYPTHR